MMFKSAVLLLLTILSGIKEEEASVATRLANEKNSHAPNLLSDEQIVKVAGLSNVNHFEYVLDTILIPRVVGTANHEFVKQFIIKTMQELDWRVESDPFEENTPIFGRLQFENVVATLNPNARRYLVLACHYDSKYYRENNFVGATDSAVPCAMMINLARVLAEPLKRTLAQNDVSLKFVFFDGEEAFQQWGPTDSIYGARHLAAKWEQSAYPKDNADGTNQLHRIDILVLLDLLGAPDPVFYSYFKETENWYRRMMAAERSLARLGQLVQYSVGKPDQYYFQQMSRRGGIEDDHIPFMIRGVPILHLIPVPFPSAWHTEDDNRNAVDIATVENLNKILRLFVAEYLHLQIPIVTMGASSSPLLFLLPLLTPSRVLLAYA
ncbi:Glutaminyl-peptide cyclotransferase [Cryptotermes secundus]|uniref:Glutaminyl-peptide cyclotransferase n=1 Tax=Cryptotermes secundus TaxID=105785 RepID=A0A2J7QED5_9NEOP|nr:glutaminyl-peptide cyclotransferase [Cryptotermes secundus]PNF26931.1 Glutaminyl-peptide cyclotransferase [Cryptotermes secundus]